jgi:hypothetical protein
MERVGRSSWAGVSPPQCLPLNLCETLRENFHPARRLLLDASDRSYFQEIAKSQRRRQATYGTAVHIRSFFGVGLMPIEKLDRI